MWSSAVPITAPETAPVPLDTVKEFLRIEADDKSYDTTLELSIAGVQDDIERLSSTRLITQEVALAADHFSDLEHLPIAPVETITSIAYDDAAGVEQTIDPECYELFGSGLQRGIRTRVGWRWPTDVRRALGAIRVVATVGYGPTEHDVPPAVAVAILRAVKAEFDGKPYDQNELARQVGNYRIWL